MGPQHLRKSVFQIDPGTPFLGFDVRKPWKTDLEPLGTPLEPLLAPSWAHLGAILGPCWAILKPSWGHLGPPWAILAHLKISWGHLAAILRHLGANLGFNLKVKLVFRGPSNIQNVYLGTSPRCRLHCKLRSIRDFLVFVLI